MYQATSLIHNTSVLFTAMCHAMVLLPLWKCQAIYSIQHPDERRRKKKEEERRRKKKNEERRKMIKLPIVNSPLIGINHPCND